MFKMRSRSKNKTVLGGSAEEEAALDDDEDNGLQFTVKEDAEVNRKFLPLYLLFLNPRPIQTAVIPENLIISCILNF
jgi:hypothetical protein